MNQCGILFDMDELLVDLHEIWTAAETRLLEAMGRSFDPELARKYKGLNARDLAAFVYQAVRPAGSVTDYQRIMQEALVKEYAGGPIRAMPGAVDLVRRLRGLAPMAVASGSPAVGIDRAMTRLGIRDCFDNIISSEAVARGKPYPDVFLAAAAMLGATPSRCLVFEDSIHGVRAAIAGGMKVFCLPSDPADSFDGLATRVFKSLADVTVDDVRAALGKL